MYYYIKSCEMSKVLQKITLVCNTEMLVQNNLFKITFYTGRKSPAFPAYYVDKGAMVISRIEDAMSNFYLLYKVGCHVYLLYKLTGLSKETQPSQMS
jgi:hypothetical protein